MAEEKKVNKLRTVISEMMLGKISPLSQYWTSISSRFAFFNFKSETINKDKVDYNLTKAIYHATPITIDGTTYGEKYYLGAVFAKPIVNATASFVIGDVPSIAFSGTENQDSPTDQAEQLTNKFIQSQRELIFDWVRGAYRDGDSYIIFEKDQDQRYTLPRILDPNCVAEIVDAKTGELQGFDLTFVVEEVDEKGQKIKVTYRKEIRKESETDFKKVGTNTEQQIAEIKFPEEQPFRVIAFHNEPDPMAVYGNSEFQSCLHLFLNYHAVLENSIKNVMYNSTPTPVLSGIENMNEFLEANFTKDDEGNYKLTWNPERMLLGGEGFKAEMLTAGNIGTDAEKTLNILFWSICQTSETPEFVFGTAVQSSNASVDSQMPVMVKKAKRKQAQLVKPLTEFTNYFLWINKTDKPFNQVNEDNLEFTIDFNPVTEADLTLNLNIAKTLIDLGIITKETAAKLCKIDDMVPDLTKEIEKATNEFDAEIKKNSIYNQPLGENPNENNNDKSTPEETPPE